MRHDSERTVYLARTRGFCAGVRRAVDTVEACLASYGAPVYVLHPIVHNRRVVEDFERRGVVFVDALADVPAGCPLVFSAHGVSAAVEAEAHTRGIVGVVDATCPLVKRVHSQARRHCAAGCTVVLVGHREHPEIIGTLGQIPDGEVFVAADPQEVAALPADLADRRIFCVAQTTLSRSTFDRVVAALRSRFPDADIEEGATVCYASSNRQSAVRLLAEQADLIIVVGSPNSSNANRLRETAMAAGVEAHLIDSGAELEADWLVGRRAVGITAGASTPEHLVDELLDRLRQAGWNRVVETGDAESAMEFKLPEIGRLRGKHGTCPGKSQ